MSTNLVNSTLSVGGKLPNSGVILAIHEIDHNVYAVLALWHNEFVSWRYYNNGTAGVCFWGTYWGRNLDTALSGHNKRFQLLESSD